jgi:hypothetical protein
VQTPSEQHFKHNRQLQHALPTKQYNTMRILFVHSAKIRCLKAPFIGPDDEHSSKHYKCNRDLPKGVIVGVALFSTVREYKKEIYGENAWACGPWCYEIAEAVALSPEKTVEFKGNLGLTTLDKSTYDTLLDDPTISTTIDQWIQHYGLSPRQKDRDVIRVLTIRQPYASAIVDNRKKVENRTHKRFPIEEAAFIGSGSEVGKKRRLSAPSSSSPEAMPAGATVGETSSTTKISSEH